MLSFIEKETALEIVMPFLADLAERSVAFAVVSLRFAGSVLRAEVQTDVDAISAKIREVNKPLSSP